MNIFYIICIIVVVLILIFCLFSCLNHNTYITKREKLVKKLIYIFHKNIEENENENKAEYIGNKESAYVGIDEENIEIANVVNNSINTIHIIKILTELNENAYSRGKTVCEEHKKLLEYCLKNETIDKNNQQYIDYVLKVY